jgi:DNA-directed RNA polymerase specialized sigma24 family protein
MLSVDSVSRWIERLKGGDSAAAQKLWEAYFVRLVALARVRLRGAPRAAADEEDVALAAFDSFCRGAAAGRFPLLADGDDLWRLLVILTARKATHQAQHENRQKRGGGALQHASALDGAGDAFANLIGREPDPAFAVEVAEQYRCLLDQLGDPMLEKVALWKMEGWNVVEIADKLGRSAITVARKLRLIRTIWEEETP